MASRNCNFIFFLSVLLVSFTGSAYASFVRALLGTAPDSSIIFDPVGYHVVDALRGEQQGNNLNYLISVNYKSFIVGTFTNSMYHQTYYIGINRNFYNYKKLTLLYTIGLMHGYGNFFKKNLGSVLGNDPGPLLALGIRYNLVKHFDFFSSYFGLGVLFGVSYRFG